jgi:hypothetical protein
MEELQNIDEWRPVASLDNYYEVSIDGRVRRCIGGAGAQLSIRKQHPNKSGYMTVKACVHGIAKTQMVHRLVAAAFLGEPPFAGAEVNHKDGKKWNNHASNLEWCSSSQNHSHAIRIGLKEKPPVKRKLSVEQVREIRSLRYVVSHGKLAKRFNVSRGTIQAVQERKNWAYVA